MNGNTSWRIRRTRDGAIAIIRFQAGPEGPASVIAGGPGEREALARAAVLAKQIATSPVFQAVAPPGTAAAIQAISELAKSKDLRKALSKYAGPGARRLAKAIRKFW